MSTIAKGPNGEDLTKTAFSLRFKQLQAELDNSLQRIGIPATDVLAFQDRLILRMEGWVSAYFIRVPLLTEEFIVARAAGKFKNYLAQLVKFDLLVLDDWGIENFSSQGQHDIFELIDARVGPRSTIITSQFPIDSWHDALATKIVADAILDRVAHSSHSIKLKGESLRKRVKKLD